MTDSTEFWTIMARIKADQNARRIERDEWLADNGLEMKKDGRYRTGYTLRTIAR